MVTVKSKPLIAAVTLLALVSGMARGRITDNDERKQEKKSEDSTLKVLSCLEQPGKNFLKQESSCPTSAVMPTTPVVVVVPPTCPHNATLIFLHGLGGNGHGWVGNLTRIRPGHVKIILPTAHTMPVTLHSGAQMSSWFDMYSTDLAGKEDEDGIKSAFNLVNSLITEEIQRGIPSERIVLGGFSQGGGLALYTALNTEHRLAGVVALSCYLPLHKQLDQEEVVNKDTPVLQAHGDADQVVQHKWGQLSFQLLESLLNKHEFRTYQGLGHDINYEEMDCVKKFLEEILH